MSDDFDVNSDGSDVVALHIRRLISDYSLVRCDDLCPTERTHIVCFSQVVQKQRLGEVGT